MPRRGIGTDHESDGDGVEQAVAVVGPNDRPDWPSAAAAWLVVSFTSDAH